MRLNLSRIRLTLAHFAIELDVALQGPVTVLFGPSGSGKTSLLEVIAGLRRAESGIVQLDSEVLMDQARGIFVPARERHFGYVPQDLALFPHLSVQKNLLYGHRSNADTKFRLEHIVEVLEIGKLQPRSVTALSGGEKQRVALARALLTSPRLLLLDEPLASLDMSLKAKILPYFARIRDEFGIPMIYVTHDRFEMLSLANELVVMANGKVLQTGSVQEVLSRPVNLSVAGILTIESIQPGRVIKRLENDLATVAVGNALLSAVASNVPPEVTEVYVCIRGDDVMLVKGPDAPSSPRNHLPATVQSITRDGSLIRVDLDCGFALAALLTQQACEELALKPGDRVLALVKAPRVHLIPR